MFELVISPALLDELEGVLTERFEMEIPVVRTLRSDIEQIAHLVVPETVPRILADPDDDEVLAAATYGHAELMVTGDKVLLRLGSHGGIPITTPREAVERLGGPRAAD